MQLTTFTETTAAEWRTMSEDLYTLSILDYHADVARIDGSWSVHVYHDAIALISSCQRWHREALDKAERVIEDHHYGVPDWRASTHG